MAAVALLGACGDDPADEAPGQVTTTVVASQAPTTPTDGGRSSAADVTSTGGLREGIPLAGAGRRAAGAARTTFSLAAPRP